MTSDEPTIVLGIDSLEPDLIEEFEPDLPNISALREESPTFRVDSIYPADSYPAWRSIFTGQTPAEHGLLFTSDVFESTKDEIDAMSNEGIEGNTFWDDLSEQGKRVCVLFPLTIFPSWPVNGTMVTRSEERREPDGTRYREIDVYPEGAVDPATVPDLRGFTGQHPGEDGLEEFRREARYWAEQDAKFSLRIAEERDWDLFFTYFMELDIVQHYFWKYCDEEDPLYQPNPHSDTIRSFYEFFDKVLGQFRRQHPDARLVVLSDHGHRRRPTKTINVNELLRQEGYLKTSSNPGRGLLESVKQVSLKGAKRLGLEHSLIRFGQRVPGADKVYTAESLVDTDESLAHLSGFRGPKSYAEGGVKINATCFNSSEEYEEFRQELISLLDDAISELTNGDGGPRWIRPREEIYEGPHEGLYPDICFLLDGDYGVGWEIGGSLLGESYEHTLSSGGHSTTATLLFEDGETSGLRPPTNILEIRTTLTSLVKYREGRGKDE